MAVSSSPRLDFEPDGIPTTTVSSTDSPVLPPSSALARFEFESGRGNEGTKILLVEWDDEDATPTSEEGSKNTGDWEVSWEGKTTVLSARDGAEDKLHRLYFLLAPGASIPRVVKLSQVGGKTIQINPLPAIFPPELGASARQAGKKGVLHTVWAKKRLSVLQKEIEAEMKTNGEGVGLEMALQEKKWIEENFGVGPKIIPAEYAASPTSPKTPSGGRLAEKLRGLKLGTTTSDLSTIQSEKPVDSHANNPLSPEMGDVAVSSFSLFHGGASRPAAGRPAARTVVQVPPNHIAANSRMNSLDAITSGNIGITNDNETEDELFAVRMSPRSPEMAKSPFSFSTKETAPWLTARNQDIE